jgi:hypothetical protein
METKVYFENIENIVLEELSKANNTVFLLVAWLNNKKLFAKLVELAEKGVIVNVIINNDETNKNSFLDYSRLNIGKSFLKMLTPLNGNIIHHKFCIIDDYTVINGSYNWTYKANYNHENINIIKNDKDSIIKYKNEFKKILPNTIQESKLSNNIKADKQIGVESTMYVKSEEQKQEEDDWVKWHKEEDKKFSTWFDNQNYYDLEFFKYLDKLNENINYGFAVDTSAEYLEANIKELLTYYDSKFKNKHPGILKYLLHFLIDDFKQNLKNYKFNFKSSLRFDCSQEREIKPYFNSKVKDLIYQDRFDKSINAYQYKLTLILIMLDFAYDDFEYYGLLDSCGYGYYDYTKEPKVYSPEIIKKLEFIRDIKLDDFNYKITDHEILEINNCIRYFSNGICKTYSEIEKSEFVIQALKKKELNSNIYDSELQFADIIVKMKVNKFDAIANEIKENGLANSFGLAKLITEINMNIDLDFITNESELKILIRNFIEQKVIIKDIVYNEESNTCNLITLQWSFDKSKEDIKKESIMINYLWLYNDFESKYDIWKKLEVEKAENKSYENYVDLYKLQRYLDKNNIAVKDFIKEDEEHINIIREKAKKEVGIPEGFPDGFNILRHFNSLKVNTARMPIRKDLIIPREIKKGKVLDELYKNEFNGERTNIQINEQVKPFIWLENGENIRVNKNAKKCKNTGQFLLFGKDYIFRQSSLVLGNSKNVLVKDDSKTDEMPKYDEIEKENQIKYNSNLPLES